MKFSEFDSLDRVLKSLEYHFSDKAEKISTWCSESYARYLRQGVDTTFRLSKVTKDGFLVLCCTSWYLPEELRCSLQLYLWERRNYFGPEYYQKISLLLESRTKMLLYVCQSNVLGNNTNEVFGRILANETKVRIQQIVPRKPKRVQRHRGYRDKGSRRQGFEFLAEEEKDYSLRELQLKIEEFRRSQDDSLQFWSGFLD